MTVFAAAVGIPAGDLAALAGTSPPAGNEIPINARAEAMAELIWEARRLTVEQVLLVRGEAEAMKRR